MLTVSFLTLNPRIRRLSTAIHGHCWPWAGLPPRGRGWPGLTVSSMSKGKAEEGAGLHMPTFSFHTFQPDKSLHCHRGANERQRRDKAYYANDCPSARKEMPPQVHYRPLVSLGVGYLLVRCPPQSRWWTSLQKQEPKVDFLSRSWGWSTWTRHMAGVGTGISRVLLMTSQYHPLLPEYFLRDHSVHFFMPQFPYVTLESHVWSAINERERERERETLLSGKRLKQIQSVLFYRWQVK